MTKSSRYPNADRCTIRAWEAPAFSVVPVRATAAQPGFHNDGWRDGAFLTVPASIDAPAQPNARQERATTVRRSVNAAWEAPAVSVFSIAGR